LGDLVFDFRGWRAGRRDRALGAVVFGEIEGLREAGRGKGIKGLIGHIGLCERYFLRELKGLIGPIGHIGPHRPTEEGGRRSFY
jgi:hypothetical protein